VLRSFAPSPSDPEDPNLLIGFATSDDAGVYRLGPELALVHTVDVFTPIVDDAFAFGQIAAANALSDIYAMAATPLTALNIAAFPRDKLPFEVLGDILRGGAAILREAGVALLGGHTVEATEPLYGLAVTGTVHPEHIAANSGARPGDALLLTKPLGTGLISTAIKRQACKAAWEAAAIASMIRLNRDAALAMQVLGVGSAAAIGGATDVTGFGLVGHALELARASNVSLHLQARSLPLLPGARELAQDAANAPGGTARNALSAAEGEVEWRAAEWWKNLAWDPQTSGGLLISVRAGDARALEDELERRQVLAARVGHVEGFNGARVVIE